MNMTDLRVKVDTRHFDLYNDLTQAGVVNEFHSLFFVSACVGFRLNQLESPLRRGDKFWSRTFSIEEWSCMYAMALSHLQGKFDQISDDKVVISLMEEFATGGLTYLIENSLKDFMLRGVSEPRLDPSATKELPQLFLFDLWQLSGETTFTGASSVLDGR